MLKDLLEGRDIRRVLLESGKITKGSKEDMEETHLIGVIMGHKPFILDMLKEVFSDYTIKSFSKFTYVFYLGEQIITIYDSSGRVHIGSSLDVQDTTARTVEPIKSLAKFINANSKKYKASYHGSDALTIDSK